MTTCSARIEAGSAACVTDGPGSLLRAREYVAVCSDERDGRPEAYLYCPLPLCGQVAERVSRVDARLAGAQLQGHNGMLPRCSGRCPHLRGVTLNGWLLLLLWNPVRSTLEVLLLLMMMMLMLMLMLLMLTLLMLLMLLLLLLLPHLTLLMPLLRVKAVPHLARIGPRHVQPTKPHGLVIFQLLRVLVVADDVRMHW